MIIKYNEHFRKLPFRRRNGYCVEGGKRFFERYGMDWELFVKEGLPEEQFLATENALAIKLVEFAHSLGE